MAKRSLIERLDEAVEARMVNRDAPLGRADRSLAALLRIAADLRDLPSESFKARLKAELISPPKRDMRAGRKPAVRRIVSPIPAGHYSATPCLVVRDAAGAIEFYKKVFGATELMRLADPGGHIAHAEIKIGDSPIAIADEAPQYNMSPQSLGGSPVIVQLYVDDVDSLAARAVDAGAKMIFPVADQFYGDRSGRFADPYGHIWIVATHKEDLSAEEMSERAEAYMAQQAVEPAPEEKTPAPEPIATRAYRAEPHLRVQGAAELIDFLKRAFGAKETARHAAPDGTISHAEVTIGDSVIGTGDATDEFEPMPTALHLYVKDADAVYRRALRAGAISTQKPTDQDYGDREAGVKDPFGNNWYIATHKGANSIPEGLGSVTPYLHPRGADKLIDFLKRAFEAREMLRVQPPGDVVHHAKIRIGESVVEMGEAHGEYGPMPAIFHLYVDDTDTVYRRAVGAGGISLSEPANQPWGFRNAGVRDPGGNQWWINAPTKKDETIGASPVPQGFHTLTPFVTVPDVRGLIDFLKGAFTADEIMYGRGGDPPHDHGQVRIGDSMVMMGEPVGQYEQSKSSLYMYVDDADAAYKRALAAGATSVAAPTDKPYGVHEASVKDPFGNIWFVATPKKDASQ